MAKNRKKSAREKRVLIGALGVAAVIMAGSTFAWFTSKDEVTNRLSASAKYDVSIAEDFQPPEDWIPGQEINKDVSAVNTGNVDAFVRMWLEGEMSVMNKLAVGDSTDIPDTISTGLGFTATTDGDTMKDLGFLYKDNNNYYRVLSTTERANAALNGTDAAVDDDTYSEVKSVQAGGYLVYAPDGASWTYTAEQQTEIIDSTGNKVVVAKDATIGSVNSSAENKLGVKDNCVIDSDTFTPITPGLYIFRRNIALGNENQADTYEYSGYVFDGTNYFALCNDTAGKSDYTLPEGAVTVATSTSPQAEPLTYTLDTNKIKLYTASEKIVKNDNLTWTYDDTAGKEKLTVTYPGADGKIGDDAATADVDESLDDIVIDVALASIGTTDQTWTAKTADGKTTTFYYNDDVEAGDSTARLVDSVTLSQDTTQYAFIAFDFDLNVFLESVQVTIGDDGNEMTTPVDESTNGQFVAAPKGNGTREGVGAYATEQDAAEIADIGWN
ncbi:MAG: BsaA family SipW-dependent biofilm matrix protein [Ruminococcus sp.]|nr:BsaA family SipW-dependent biofilm matrix protein [Ruminococcus sp.]MBR2284622.1 BsaA family SipW-dependent biofilm matrix protein [Ruminococcus sp.]